MESPDSATAQSNIPSDLYPKVMHRIIDGVSNGWLFGYSAYGSGSEFGERNTLPHALIETHHSRLVEALLVKDVSPHAFANIIYAHIERGESDVALDILRRYPSNQTAFDANVLIEKVALESMNDESLKGWMRYFIDEEEHFHIFRFLQKLWSIGRYNLTSDMVRELFPSHQRPSLLLWQKIMQKETVTEADLREAFRQIGDVESKQSDARDPYRQESSIMSHVISALDESGADLNVIRVAIEMQDAYKTSKGFTSWSNRYEIEGKIRERMLAAGDFAAAEAFTAATGERYYLLDEIAQAKMKYAAEKGDQVLYWQGLETYVKNRDRHIEELIRKRDNPNAKDYDPWNWTQRLELHKERAWKYAHIVLHDLRFRDAEAAKQSMDQMVEAVETSEIPGKDDCPDRHKKTLWKRRKMLKKDIKRFFLAAGYLDALPREKGWQTPPMHPDLLEMKREQRMKRLERYDNPPSDSALNYESSSKLEIKTTMTSIEKGEIDEAMEYLLKQIDYHAHESDWTRACLLLNAKPELFALMTPKLTEKYFNRNESRNYFHTFDWKGLASYYAAAHRNGVLNDGEWKKLFDGLHNARFTDEGLNEISSAFVTTFVHDLIEGGDCETAWKAYERLNEAGRGYATKALSSTTHQTCLSFFVRALENAGGETAASIMRCLRDNDLNGDVPEGDMAYWNMESEVQRMLKDEKNPEPAVQKIVVAEKKTIELCDSPRALREWTRLMAMGTMRTPHEKKDALLEIYARETTNARMRHRIVDTMIQHKIPGAESMVEIKKRDTPDLLAKHFFRKLVKQGILHEHTLEYLKDDVRHLPHLKNLLSNHQNDFNTTMDTLQSRFDRYHGFGIWNPDVDCNDDDSDRSCLDVQEWDGVFTTLRHVGMFTPGVYAEARKGKFSPMALNGIVEKIALLKKKLFSNQPFDGETSPELLAEVIYASYKPVNMSLKTVVNLCRQLQDCSSHLDGYTYPQEGYVLDVRPRRTMKRTSPLAELQTQEAVSDITRFSRASNRVEVDDIRGVTKSLCNIGRLKTDDQMSLGQLMIVFREEPFLQGCVQDVANACTDDDRHKALLSLQEMFGVYFNDNAESVLAKFFNANMSNIGKMITVFAGNIRSPKLRKSFEAQCKISVDPSMDDVSLSAKVIAVVLQQKFKPLQEVQKSIKIDLTKFVAEGGGETFVAPPKLRAIISKNVASFFGKASAGICTHANIDLFNREDHFNINILDEEKQICVGNVQAYVMQHDGQPHLLLRGFNPNTALLKEVDAEAFCDSIIAVGEQFVADNKLAGIILSEPKGVWFALSNRPEINAYLTRKYHQCMIAIEPFVIANQAEITSGYLVSSNKTVERADTPSESVAPDPEPFVGSFE